MRSSSTSHFMNEEAEAQRGATAISRSYSTLVAELSLGPYSPVSQFYPGRFLKKGAGMLYNEMGPRFLMEKYIF